MKFIFASHLLFKAGLIVLLSLELDECLSAMDSDSEVYFEIQYYICAKHGDFKPVFFFKDSSSIWSTFLQPYFL